MKKSISKRMDKKLKTKKTLKNKHVGGKHNTTVIHSIKKVEHQKSSNKDYDKLIKMFFDSLK